MGKITAADAVVTLSIATLFENPQQLQGFAADDVTDVPQIKSVETVMGVDGVLSAGFVFVPVLQTITLQADSLSNRVFDQWWQQMQSTKDVFIAQGVIRFPAIGSKFVQNDGYLTGYKPLPGAKKLLQPRTYEITWNSIVAQPA